MNGIKRAIKKAKLALSCDVATFIMVLIILIFTESYFTVALCATALALLIMDMHYATKFIRDIKNIKKLNQ